MIVGGFRPLHVVVIPFFFLKKYKTFTAGLLLAFIETPKQISVFWQKCHFQRCFAFLAWSDFHAHLPVSPVLQSMKKKKKKYSAIARTKGIPVFSFAKTGINSPYSQAANV